MPLSQLPERTRPLAHRLGQARLRGRVAHSCLVTGDHLDTLWQLAMSWAQVCMCRDLTPEGDACGSCRSCRQIEQQTYPYLYVLRPQSKSRQILIDDIRDLEHRLYLTSDGNLKIGVILEADRLNEQAQNAFLKTLEEPPSNTLLFLVTVSPSSLLPTILSRCQLISLLDNRVVYEQPDQDQLVRVLATMKRGAGAAVALPAAEFLLDMLKGFDAHAKANVVDSIAALKANYENLDPAERKRLDSVCEAVEKAEYLRLRDVFLSALHAWFAQEYLRANGIGGELLPNPELYFAFGDELPVVLPQADALRGLRLTEDFIDSLRFNVDEGLAMHDYCQKVCAKV